MDAMWFKIITLAGAALSLYFMLGRFMGGSTAEARKRGAVGTPAARPGGLKGKADVEDLSACPRCGAYRNSSELCDCERAPVP